MSNIFQERIRREREEYLNCIFAKVASNVSEDNPTGETNVYIEVSFWAGTDAPVIGKLRFGDEEEDGTIDVSLQNLELHYEDYPEDDWCDLDFVNTDDLARIADDLECMPESYHLDSLSPEDLEQKGFKTKDVSPALFQKLAEKMADDYHEQLFWDSLDIIAEILGFQKEEEKDDGDGEYTD